MNTNMKFQNLRATLTDLIELIDTVNSRTPTSAPPTKTIPVDPTAAATPIPDTFETPPHFGAPPEAPEPPVEKPAPKRRKAPPAPAVDYLALRSEVSNVITTLVERGKKESVKALLAKYDVDRARELRDERTPELLADLNALAEIQ